MVRILLYIKHNLPGIWRLTERINGFLFSLLYEDRFKKIIPDVLCASSLNDYTCRLLEMNDLHSLEAFLIKQPSERVEYFKPHGFNYNSLLEAYNNPAFFMFGIFKGEEMAGYFFLRCFLNKKSFVGRIISQNYEGKGIGKEMNRIMYNTGWNGGFRVLSTISKNNNLVMRSHARNPYIVIRKELKNNYVLVEFLPEACQQEI